MTKPAWSIPVRLEPVLWAGVPALGWLYQYCAEQLAHRLSDTPVGLHWFAAAAQSPWAPVLLAAEAASFVCWMVVLSRHALGRAFPLTAAGYIGVMALAWFGLGEPVHPLTALGGAAILAGIWLLAQDEDAQDPAGGDVRR